MKVAFKKALSRLSIPFSPGFHEDKGNIEEYRVVDSSNPANNKEAMNWFKVRRARTDPVKGLNKCQDKTYGIQCPAFSLNRKSFVKGGFGAWVF